MAFSCMHDRRPDIWCAHRDIRFSSCHWFWRCHSIHPSDNAGATAAAAATASPHWMAADIFICCCCGFLLSYNFNVCQGFFPRFAIQPILAVYFAHTQKYFFRCFSCCCCCRVHYFWRSFACGFLDERQKIHIYSCIYLRRHPTRVQSVQNKCAIVGFCDRKNKQARKHIYMRY